MGYFFDSYAIIEIIKGNPNYLAYSGEIFITTTINLAEVYYSLIRTTDEKIANEIINKFNFEFLGIDKESTIDAAKLKHLYKKEELSYIDCVGYVLAKNNGMKFLTGDEKFEKKENVEFVVK